MNKNQEILKQEKIIADLQSALHQKKLDLAFKKRFEDKKKEFGKYKYKLVNGEVHPFTEYEQAGYSEGLPGHLDDYGQGSCSWPLLEKPEDAELINKRHNMIWAVRRLQWAVTNNPKEIPGLFDILDGKKLNFKLAKSS